MADLNFGDFALKNDNTLYYLNEFIRLPPKEINILRLLIERHGQIVSKEDIIKHVWKGGIVSDESLTRCIYIIRKTLEVAHPGEYIDTLYCRGYRFIHPVEKSVAENIVGSVISKDLSILIIPFATYNYQQTDIAYMFERMFKTFLLGRANIIPSWLAETPGNDECNLDIIKKIKTDVCIHGRFLQTAKDVIFEADVVSGLNHYILFQEELHIPIGDIDKVSALAHDFVTMLTNKICQTLSCVRNTQKALQVA